MADITVGCQADDAGGWICRVAVGENNARTEHSVSVTTDDLARLAPGASDPTELVRRSFQFLLAREPKESILRRFALTDIARYFPEWESTITTSTGSPTG